MTRSLHALEPMSPTTLVEGYVAALEREHAEILAQLDAMRAEWAVLEDRAHALNRLRDRHIAAHAAIVAAAAAPTPPTTLHDLVSGDVGTGVAATD